MYEVVKLEKKVRYTDRQKGDVDVTHSDISKAKKILNYNPKVSIEQGLENQFEWLLSS